MTFRFTSVYPNYPYLLIGLVTMFFLLNTRCTQSQILDENSWKLAKDKAGIQIYTRQIKDKKLKEFKASASIKTTVEKIICVLQDIDNYDKWTEHIDNSSLLKKISDDETYVYSVADIPWPFTNRDIINHVQVHWSPLRDTAILEIHGVPDYIPEKKGIIRMPISEGKWKIYKEDEFNVHIEYSYTADPGGHIPAWVVNMIIVDGPYKTILRMKDYVEPKK